MAKYFGSNKFKGSFDFGRSKAPGSGKRGISVGKFFNEYFMTTRKLKVLRED
jgi:hypothetical protein